MAFTEALRLLITADTRGAVRGVTAVGQATDKSLGKSQKTIDKWGKGLTTAGAGMVAFGGAVLFGLGKAALASEEANLSVIKLQNSMDNNPRLAGANIAAFTDLADSIQDKTAADADAIVAGQAVLAQRKLDINQIKELTPLVVDLARKKGIDEVAAFTLAAKAVDGNAGALKRAGISVDEAAFKTDAYGATVDALKSSVGGFAEEEGKTFAGSLERLKNQMGDLAEGVGAGAVDAFSDLFGVFGGGIEKLNQLSPGVQSAIGKFATFGSVALVAAGGLSFVIGQVITARQRFADLGTAIGSLRGRLAGLSGVLGAAGVAGALLAAGAAIATYLKNQNEQKVLEGAEAFAKLRDNSREAAAATGVFNDAVKVSTTTFTATASAADVLAKSGKFTEQAMRDLDQGFSALLEKAPHLADEFIKSAEAKGVDADAIRRWKGELEGKISTDGEAIASQEEYNAAVEESSGVTEDATSALQEYSDTLKGLVDPIFAAMDAITGMRDAQLDEYDAAVAVMQAQSDLNEAREGGNADEVAEAERNLADAQRGLADAQNDTIKSAAEQDAALAGLLDAVNTGKVGFDEFEDTLATWVRQGAITQAQADDAADRVRGLGDAASDADKERVDIPVTTPGAPKSRTELRQVRDAALDVPTRTTTTARAVDRATSTFDIVRAAADLLDGKTATVYINVSGAAAAANALARAGRQHGGPVLANEAYVVGEAGPELLIMGNQSGLVVPNLGRPMGGGMAMSGPGVHNHFHIAGSVLSEGDLIRTVNKAVSNGRVHDRGRRL